MLAVILSSCQLNSSITTPEVDVPVLIDDQPLSMSDEQDTYTDEQDNVLRLLHLNQVTNQPRSGSLGAIVVRQGCRIIARLIQCHSSIDL